MPPLNLPSTQERIPVGAPLVHHATVRSTVREFVLIAAGVLVALAGQSVWQERVERARERMYVEQLLRDMKAIESQLTVARADEGRSAATTIAILSAIRNGGSLPEDSVGAWMTPPGWVFWYGDPRLVTGTITALIQTGDLALIRDDSLRISISGYTAAMDAEWSEFSRWVDQTVHWMTAFFERGTQIVGDFPVGETMEDRVGRASLFLVAMQDEPLLRAILLNIQNARRNRVFYLDRMQSETERLRQVLERR